MILGDYLGHYLRRNSKMAGQGLIQDLEISYYGIMSKFAQYRRNMLKNRIPSTQAQILQKEVIA
jgi:hypothetical protein